MVVWILGNDLPDAGTVIGVGTAAPMATRVCQLDTTRPLTTAIFGWNGGMSWKWEAADPPEEVTQLT